ncbi:MAG: [LysW]-aminoadipate kinase [Anaerolineaceae bacterium]|nr:[LysW]-aminoadipate kinase [Anaerolineaceae bacterium]
MLVIKIGGTEGVDFNLLCSEIAAMVKDGKKIVVVHGGSKDANELGEQVGYPPRFLTSPQGYTSRYTDARTLEIFSMAVKGKVNMQLVSKLQQAGVNAFGLSGLDGKFILAQRKKALRSMENGKRKVIRDDHSGKIKRVNANIIHWLLDQDMIPVIAPMAASFEGECLNVDADRAAAMVAGAMKAETLLLFTAVKGLYRKFPDESSWIPYLKESELETAMQYAEGRMKKKVLGAQEALAAGVNRVAIADGSVKNSIANALAGNATWIGGK